MLKSWIIAILAESLFGDIKKKHQKIDLSIGRHLSLTVDFQCSFIEMQILKRMWRNKGHWWIKKALNSYDVTVGGNDKSVRILEIF